MRGSIRRAVIRRIAHSRRVSLSVAAYIYNCLPVKARDRLCRQEQARAALKGEKS